MQGGDFVYAETISKDGQQKDAEKRSKKPNFQLSKILPSPSKQRSEVISKILKETGQYDPSADTSSDKRAAIGDHDNQEEVAEAVQETEDETSDGDWYVIIMF